MVVFDESDYLDRFLKKSVDAFEQEGKLPDYFTRYGLPESVTAVPEIEQRIEAVLRFWNRQKTNPRWQALLGVLLSPPELKDSKTCLCNPKAREAYREWLTQERRRAKDALLEAIDDALAVVASKGYITPIEEQSLVRNFAQAPLSEAEVKTRISKVPLREPAPPPEVPVLKKELKLELKRCLAIFRCRDVWEFLGIPARASVEAVQTACEAKTVEWRPKPPDNRKTAADKLLAMVRRWKSDEDIIRYDNSVQIDRLSDHLDKALNVALADGRLDQQEVRNLLEQAEALGVQEFIARAFVEQRAREAGVPIEGQAPAEDTIRCKACHHRSPSTRDHCLNAACKKPLWSDCARCNERKALADALCPTCGFNERELPKVKHLKELASAALGEGDAFMARRLLRELETAWGRRPDVATLFARLVELEKARQVAWRSCLAAIESKELYKAQAGLSALLTEDPEFAADDGQRADERALEVERLIARVEDLIDQATKAASQGQFDEAYSHLLEARRRAVDAKIPPLSCPPRPAGHLAVTFHQDHMAVTWLASPSGGPIEYVVVRRDDRPPVSQTDGVEIGATPATGLVDRTVRPGTVVYYAVFALREGAASSPVVSPGIQAVAEVASLVLTTGDGEVTGTWEQPAGCVVRVCRLVGRAPDPGEGTPVEVTYRAFFDGGLKNSETYGYRVSAEYTLPDGTVVTTPGLTATACPQAPPAPIADLALSLAPNSGITISWTPPAAGVVALYRLTSPPRWSRGSALSTSDREALGAPISTRASGASWQDAAPLPGVSYYLPVTVHGGQAIVGQALEYVALPDVTGLEVEDFETYLQLRWAWPGGCTQALVTWRADAYPAAADDGAAQRVLYTRGEYEALGGFRIERPEEAPYWIKVFAGIPLAGVTRFSSGLAAGAVAAVRQAFRPALRYALVRGLFFRSRFTVELSAEMDLPDPPELVVVVKRGRDRPLDPEDGAVVSTISPQPLAAGNPLRHVVDLSAHVPPFCLRVFFQDRRSYERFRLQDPNTASLRVG